MSKKRTDLQTILEEVSGNRHVYFNPKESIRLEYPCVVYNLSKTQLRRSNNKIYQTGHVYDCTRITKDPEDDFVERIAKTIPYVSPGTNFCSDNLYHYTFTVYYG